MRVAKEEQRRANPPAEPYENGPAYGPYMGTVRCVVCPVAFDSALPFLFLEGYSVVLSSITLPF